LTELEVASAADVEEAIRSAKVGQKVWAGYTGMERARVSEQPLTVVNGG
jgi:acyl-CoA reductase-like NAD-dependent aldehyde dehydrogenase